MSSNKVVLSVKGLKKNFGDLHVLKDFNLEVHEGEVISIIGPSGTGKSTSNCTIFRPMEKAPFP